MWRVRFWPQGLEFDTSIYLLSRSHVSHLEIATVNNANDFIFRQLQITTWKMDDGTLMRQQRYQWCIIMLI